MGGGGGAWGHTEMRHILFSEKFGVMVTSSFSARNSTSEGSIAACHHFITTHVCKSIIR